MPSQISPVNPLGSTPSSSTVAVPSGGTTSGSASLASPTGLSGLGGSMDAAPRLGTLPGAMTGTALAKSETDFEAGGAKMVINAGEALANLMGDPVKKA